MVLNIHKLKTMAVLLVTLLTGAASYCLPAAAGAESASNFGKHAQSDCPPGIKCKIVLAALKDGGCNYSTASRPEDLPIYGIHEHTTEGTLQQALDEAQDTNNCVSWNYLIDQSGTVYVSVPTSSLAYDVGNWWFNTHYVQVEHIGTATDCASITPAEYAASVQLNRYLIQRFHLKANSQTITGHDSIPAVSDNAMASRHWDPGVCWPWAKYLAASGAPIVPTASPASKTIIISTDNSKQPVQDCPGIGFTDCKPAKQDTTNFMALYSAPSTSAPLLSDPYIHSDGSAGTTAMQDWGDKAPTGHSYVVVDRKAGWTAIQYAGKTGWFRDNGRVSVPTSAATITPKGTTAIPVYGRPLPEASAPGWANIPYDQQTQVALTKYSIQPGQKYTVVDAPVRNDYAEGCNKADCSGPGDKTVVIGNTKYIEISYGHHFVFVKADDVRVSAH